MDMAAVATIPIAALDPAGVLAQASGWASAYLFCLIVGGGFLLFSLVFGGQGEAGDVDFDGAAGVDVDAGGGEFDMDASGGDVDLDAGGDLGADGAADAHEVAGHATDIHHGPEWLSLSSWLSFRFLIYFMATFGAVGTVLTYLSDLGVATKAVASIGSGLVVGQAVQQLFRRLQRGPDSSVSRADYVRRIGRVTVAIAPGRKGEVAVEVADSQRFVPARAQRDTDGFAVGEQVVLTAYDAGTATVVSRKEYEFLHEEDKGAEA